MLVSYKPLAGDLRRLMIIGNYTADVSVGETAPSPISPEPSCRKDTIRGGRVLDGGDACHVSAGESPAGVGVGSIELSRDEADTVDMLRSSLGGESSRDDAARSSDRFDGGGAECACRNRRDVTRRSPSTAARATVATTPGMYTHSHWAFEGTAAP